MKTTKTIPNSDLKKIPELEAKILDLQDKLTRSLADYINLEKRIESQRQLIITLGTISIISKMVDVLDDLTLTQSHLQDQGLQITLDKFRSVLKSEGLSEINPVGLEFDPNSMECIHAEKGEENKVLSVSKVGYSLNSQVIRPAQVVVGKNQDN